MKKLNGLPVIGTHEARCSRESSFGTNCSAQN
jgi:hypothetical protein